ncbi:uncharacterized protein LOC129924120 isoform X3 [Biomphalaria glabrata]|uniref:Uncharacterized protein LOC129924120 isoform X3 n=1 Tax=Biomphalaria glabrata TaxID=6526 RepID=A0A9W2ZG47_BIOGL|nr:uncharacterized protein LOC129924120 isoform X3 [Biomphalaria glabrata]
MWRTKPQKLLDLSRLQIQFIQLMLMPQTQPDLTRPLTQPIQLMLMAQWKKKILMVISICSTFLIAVALVCTGILIYIWKRVFNVGSGHTTAVQFSIQSNAVVCTSNAAEEIEIANSTEENHVYDSVIYTGYQTFQPKTSEDLTETINSNATSISDLSIQPETLESLTESIPTSIADQTPKTSEGLTITINGTSTRIADQTETDPVYINMACQTIQPKSSECLIESIYKIPTNNAVRIFQPKTSESQTATVSRTSTCVADQTTVNERNK